MHQMCLPKPEVDCGSNKKGKYGLNYDEQAKLAAEEISKNRRQRFLQVREQEREFARSNRQAYEHRLSQERKRLYAELLQKWDRQQQGELQSLQDAYQKAVDEASAAQEQANQTAAAAQEAEAAAVARRAIQAGLAAKRSAEAAQQACLERDILARERDRRKAWLQQARDAEKTRAAEQVMKQQEAQRRAAEEARERQKRRGRDTVYDFRFTRFHETGLEQQIDPELPNERVSIADSAEMHARKAARRAEQVRAAEERGRAALHKARMERAARDLTAQLEAELQARRSAAAAALPAPSHAALQSPRAMGTAPAERQMERHYSAINPSFDAAQPALRQAAWPGMASVAPNLATMPHASWPQPTPWSAHIHPMYPSGTAQTAAAHPPGQPTDRHTGYLPQECQPAATGPTQQPADRPINHATHESQPAAAAARGAVHASADRAASLADKTTQCPEAVDRQTQTESPDPDTLPATRVPRPYPLHRLSVQGTVPPEHATVRTAPVLGTDAAHPDTSLAAQHPPPQEATRGTGRAQNGHGGLLGSDKPSNFSAGVNASAAAENAPVRCNAQGVGAVAGHQDTGNDCSGEIVRADTVGVPTEDMVRTLPGELSDSCCSSRAASVACLADLAPEAAAQPQIAASHPPRAAAPQMNPLQEVSMAAGNPADAVCTISITAKAATSTNRDPAVNKDEGVVKRSGSALVHPQEGGGKSGNLPAPLKMKEPLAPHMSGAFLAQAAAELEALCAESLGNVSADPLGFRPSMAPQHSKPSMRGHRQTLKSRPQKPAQQGGPAEGRPIKTALQKAEELLARLTEDAAAWDMTACPMTAPQPSTKEQQPGCQAKQQGQEMSSLEVLAERLQDAISDTFCMTESMLTHPYAQPNVVASKVFAAADTSKKKSTSWSQPKPSSGQERSPAAERSAGALRQEQLGSRDSVASSSCSSLLGALHLASIGEETSPDKDAHMDVEGGDLLSCSGNDAASDLPFDALSLGSTQLGTPLSGGREDGWLSDIESLDLEDSIA